MNWILVPVIAYMGMQGGQWIKGVRRFGIPGIAVTYLGAMDIKDKKIRWRAYGLALLSFVLAMGYGENSFYMKIFKKDWLVRIMYGLTLSIPFWIADFTIGLYATLALPLAWSIRSEWLTKIGLHTFKVYKQFEFIWVDLIRYTTVGVLVALVV